MKDTEHSEYTNNVLRGLNALLARKRQSRPELNTKEVYKKLSDVVRQARNTKK
jgi:hypothetical protein